MPTNHRKAMKLRKLKKARTKFKQARNTIRALRQLAITTHCEPNRNGDMFVIDSISCPTGPLGPIGEPGFIYTSPA
jgi:hypothetical protein